MRFIKRFYYRLLAALRVLLGLWPMSYGAWQEAANDHLFSYMCLMRVLLHRRPDLRAQIVDAIADDQVVQPFGRAATLAEIVEATTGLRWEDRELERVPALGGDREQV